MEAWYMDDSDEDQRAPHKKQPNEPVSYDTLDRLGVLHWEVSTPYMSALDGAYSVVVRVWMPMGGKQRTTCA
jgi:hypothetical protein